MGKNLTANQAHVLFQIVKYGRRNGGLVPTDQELGSILGISAPMANRYRQQLGRKLKCFQQYGRRSKVNDDSLCTQPDSALYLLIFYDKGQTGRVSKTAFHNFLLESFSHRFSLERIQYIFECAVNSCYLKIVEETDYLEPGPRLAEAIHYLELLPVLLIHEEMISKALERNSQ